MTRAVPPQFLEHHCEQNLPALETLLFPRSPLPSRRAERLALTVPDSLEINCPAVLLRITALTAIIALERAAVKRLGVTGNKKCASRR